MVKLVKNNIEDSVMRLISDLLREQLPPTISFHLDRIANCQAPIDRREDLISPSASLGRKLEFTAGRNSLRASVKNLKASPLIIGRHSNGAPKLPNDLVGSISHKYPVVATICGKKKDYSALGIDIEKNEQWEQSVISTFVAREDITSNSGVLMEENLLLSVLFSAKESAFKAISSLDQSITPHLLDISICLKQKTIDVYQTAIKWRNLELNGFTIVQAQWVTCVTLLPNV
jgi:4'-phosphopantetheinyl transferase EntD